MHVISPKKAREFAKVRPDARNALEHWLKAAKQAQWQSLRDVRTLFPHADAATVRSGKTVTIFNMCGNKYRLITAIHYPAGKLFLLLILKHSEYDSNRWKEFL